MSCGGTHLETRFSPPYPSGTHFTTHFNPPEPSGTHFATHPGIRPEMQHNWFSPCSMFPCAILANLEGICMDLVFWPQKKSTSIYEGTYSTT